jgi:hypothetical protein
MTNRVEKVGNVIIFPKARIKYPKRVGKLPKLSDLSPKIELDKGARVDNILTEVLTSAVEILERHHVRCPAINKEESFYGEALKSMIMKRFEMKHPFQQLASEFFEEGENGKITFKKVEE